MSNIGHLLERYREHPAVTKLSQELQHPQARVQLTGLTGAQLAFVLAAMVDGRRLTVDGRKGDTPDNLEQPTSENQPPHEDEPSTVYRLPSTVLFIAEGKEEAAYLLNDLQGILPEELVHFFPDSFKRPAVFDDINQTNVLQRSEVISKLSSTAGNAAIVLSYPEALFEKVVSPEVLAQSQIDITKGEELDVEFVIQVLVEYGFERADFVYEPGQFSLRGGIVDLFSFGNELPYRIELFDKEVESIRTFDPLTQLSKQSMSRVRIVPNLNTRFRQDQKVPLFQILPENTVIWIRDFQFLLDRLQYCFEKAEQYAEKISALDAAELRELFRDRAFVYPREVVADVRGHALVFLEKPGAGVLEMLEKT